MTDLEPRLALLRAASRPDEPLTDRNGPTAQGNIISAITKLEMERALVMTRSAAILTPKPTPPKPIDTRPTAPEGSELNMDGSLHIVGDWCGKPHHRRCPKCDGVLHMQGIYGGLMETCERCDIEHFMPAGTYEHDGSTIIGEKAAMLTRKKT